ncbi:hypothetical protein G7Y79_00001g003990 [Physcia stellaris]|nr:hypothetical protein G7Y79_00001g003990 [Physcia stellaris]
MVAEHQDFIISWIKEALLDGEFVESDPGLDSAVELQPSDSGRAPKSVLRLKSLKPDARHKLLPSPQRTDFSDTDTYLNNVKADYISVIYGGLPSIDNPKLQNSDYNRTGTTDSERYDLGAFPTELLPFINNSIIREEDIEQYHELSITRDRNNPSPFLDFASHQIKNIHSGKYLGLDQYPDGDINQLKATCADAKAASCWEVVKDSENSYQIFANLPATEVPHGICYRQFARPEIRLASLVPERKPLAFEWTLECLGQASSLFKIRPSVFVAFEDDNGLEAAG